MIYDRWDTANDINYIYFLNDQFVFCLTTFESHEKYHVLYLTLIMYIYNII
jgi:hypothetical protein